MYRLDTVDGRQAGIQIWSGPDGIEFNSDGRVHPLEPGDREGRCLTQSCRTHRLATGLRSHLEARARRSVQGSRQPAFNGEARWSRELVSCTVRKKMREEITPLHYLRLPNATICIAREQITTW